MAVSPARFARIKIPYANVAHEICSCQVMPLVTEGTAHHGRRMAESGHAIAGESVEDLHGRLVLWRRLVLPPAGKVLPGDGRQAFAIWR